MAGNARRAEINESWLSTSDLGATLGRRTARGGALTVVTQAVTMLVQVIAAAILARLLEPGDFGLIAMAATVTGFVALFTDLGLTTSTIQRPELTQRTTSTLFFIAIMVGVSMMTASIAISPLAARLFEDDRVIPLIAGLSISIPITAAASQHSALLMRRMRWGAVNMIGLAAQTTGAAAAVLLALFTDLGYWVLVAMPVVIAVVRSTGMWVACGWRPSAIFDWRGARSEIGFGLNLTGFNAINYFHRQADNILIGARWGEIELGFYNRAYNLMMMPLTLINGPVTATMIPLLSRAQNDPELWKRYLLQAMSWVCFAGFGVACLLIVNADALIMVYLGPGWNETAKIFSYLSVSLFGATIMNAAGWIYISLNRSRRMLQWSLISSTVFVLSFVVGLPGGADSVAYCYAFAVCLMVLPCLWYATLGTPINMWPLIRTLAGPLACGILSLVVGHELVRLLAKNQHVIERLLLGTALTGAIHAAACMIVIAVDPWQTNQRKMLKAIAIKIFGHLSQVRNRI